MSFLKKHKFLFSLVFLICIFFSVQKVYGYNLAFEVKYIDEASGSRMARFQLSAHKSSKSQADYNAAVKGTDGWVFNVNTNTKYFGAKNTPTDGNYITRSLLFFPMSQQISTNYNNSSGSNNMKVSWLKMPRQDSIIEYGNGQYIESFGYEEGSVSTNLGNGNTDLSHVGEVDASLREIRFKIEGDLNIAEYYITPDTLLMLSNMTQDGRIRVSTNNYTLKTSYSNLDPRTRLDMVTAWQFYAVTQSPEHSWMPYTRGCEAGSSKGNCIDPAGNAKNSSINGYDNILVLPVDEKYREVYVRHLDQNGNLLTGYSESGDNPPIQSSNSPVSGFSEYYKIPLTSSLTLRALNINKYLGSYMVRGNTFGEGFNLINGRAHTPSSTSTRVSIAPGTKQECIFVDFYYNIEPTVYESKLDLIGDLNFINTLNNSNFSEAIKGQEWFTTSTSEEAPGTDYIASGFTLVPYISKAYPYVVRGLNYELITVKGWVDNSATVAVSCKGTYDDWESCSGYVSDGIESGCQDLSYSNVYGDCEDEEDEEGNVIPCDPPVIDRRYSGRKHVVRNYGCSDSETKRYSIPYEYRYFRINNFKMYGIEKMEVFDDGSNRGGTLFNGSQTYTVYPSADYINRFGTGMIRNTHYTTPVSNSKTIASYSEHCGWYSSSCSYLDRRVADDLRPYRPEDSGTYSLVASTVGGMTAKLGNNHNDYINLDGGNVLIPNSANETQTSVSINLASDSRFNGYRKNSALYDDTKIFVGTKETEDAYITNVPSYITPSVGKQTTLKDWNKQQLKIIEERTNGARLLRASIYYKLVGTDTKLQVNYNSGNYNIGSNTFDDTCKWTALTRVTANALLPDVHDISGDAHVNEVNVLTPVNVPTTPPLSITESVDHSSGVSNTNMLQRNSWFTLNPSAVSSSVAGYKNIPTAPFVKAYYFVFDFDIAEAEVNGRSLGGFKKNRVIKAESNGNPITFRAKTTEDFGEPTVQQVKNSYRVFATAWNVTKALETYIVGLIELDPFGELTGFDFVDANEIKEKTGMNQGSLLGRSDIEDDAYHMIGTQTVTTSNLARIFDFRITDCSDVNFKDVFRTTDQSGVNKSTGKFYYSGTKTWLRDTVNNTVSTNTIRYLPLGPYKHDPQSYINAPKLGYRFSYDLKTTGYLTDGRRVEITPNYYYISKDGKTFKENIRLYYKNSTGSYVPISGYKIYFTPNDGYRYILNQGLTADVNAMSTKLESMDITKTFTLDSRFMATSNDKYYQSWFGEYKLPNSAIAFEGTGNIDLTKPLTDGYIGVKFSIKVVDSNGSSLGYNVNDKAVGSAQNTTQWDYEGFLGFNNPGSAANVSLQLEKGTWNINNDTYQKVKGTVILYDADARAANDFE